MCIRDRLGRFHGDGHDQERLDAWAAQHTDGRIPRMPVTIDRETLVVLANALIVCTGWQEPFDVDPMHCGFPGRVGSWMGLTNIACLSRVGTEADDLLIAESTSVGPLTLLEIRGHQDISVYLALAGQKALPGGVVAEAIRAAADSRQGRRGSTLTEGYGAPGLSVKTMPSIAPMPTTLHLLTVPFRIEVEHDLLRSADVFGLQSATNRRRGHFPRISRVPLAVSHANQAAMAAFSAKGFEAAAVTAVGLTLGASLFGLPGAYQHLAIMVRFDRPFAFVAVHRPSRLVLVAGWVASPQPVTNPPAW